MGRKTFTIGEIVQILDIPASTLRFWERKNLFHIEKSENSYRRYTTTDLIHIADMMFYRNLGIPVKQVNNFSEISLQEYGSALELSQKQLDEQIQEFAQMQRRIQLQKERYDTLQQLMAEPYRVERLPFRYVVGWEFWERENLLRYIEDPARYVWFRDTSSENTGCKGLIWEEIRSDQEKSLLWQKQGEPRFLTFPIRALEADNYQGVEAEEVIAMVQEKYRTGVFLACHLLTCTKEGESVEYLKGYLELREAK